MGLQTGGSCAGVGWGVVAVWAGRRVEGSCGGADGGGGYCGSCGYCG